jgi:hypothetical protein
MYVCVRIYIYIKIMNMLMCKHFESQKVHRAHMPLLSHVRELEHMH